MISYHIEFQGLEEQLAKFDGMGAMADRELETAMKKSVISIEGKVKPLVPVGVSARLRNSIGTEVTHLGTFNIQGKVGSSLKDEIYPSVMEFGRRPGAPGPAPAVLYRWVHLKLGIPDKDVPGVAWSIARKIHRAGIKGKQFMAKGFLAAKSSVETYFVQALEAIAKGLENGR